MGAAVAGDLLCQPVRRVVLCGAYERAVARGLRDGDVILRLVPVLNLRHFLLGLAVRCTYMYVPTRQACRVEAGPSFFVTKEPPSSKSRRYIFLLLLFQQVLLAPSLASSSTPVVKTTTRNKNQTTQQALRQETPGRQRRRQPGARDHGVGRRVGAVAAVAGRRPPAGRRGIEAGAGRHQERGEARELVYGSSTIYDMPSLLLRRLPGGRLRGGTNPCRERHTKSVWNIW